MWPLQLASHIAKAHKIESVKFSGKYSSGASNACHQCEDCGRVFQGPKSLREHVDYVHKNIINFPCDLCPSTFVSENHRQNHKKKVHWQTFYRKPLEERKAIPCDQCGLKFAEKSQVDRHVRTVHLKIKQYRCKICDTFFVEIGNLKEHIGIKHMGYANSKEWRRPENKDVRTSASSHPAYEFIPQKGTIHN